MSIIKSPIFLALFAIYSISVSAQKQAISATKKLNVEENSKNDNREIAPQFSTTSIERQPESIGQSILQEIFLIDDQRQNIEKNQSLSPSERSQQIQENNTIYLVKKDEFVNYITSKGLLNVPPKEQNYYLYILKNDKNDLEYSRNVELIKNAK